MAPPLGLGGVAGEGAGIDRQRGTVLIADAAAVVGDVLREGAGDDPRGPAVRFAIPPPSRAELPAKVSEMAVTAPEL